MTAKHTPGPWELVEGTKDGNAVISPPIDSLRAGDTWWTAVIICTDPALQNTVGRIMHAAPDLLAALKKVVAIADRKTVEFDEARAAIAKAESAS